MSNKESGGAVVKGGGCVYAPVSMNTDWRVAAQVGALPATCSSHQGS